MHEQPARVEVLNDINGDLVNLYRVVQYHLEEFVRQFKWALTSRQVFQWLQETVPHTLTDIQRAARFFYLQHHAFGGRVAGQNFGTATTAPAINLLRIEENLSAAHMRLAGVTVENFPCFLYMDPPYWKTEGYGVPFAFDEYLAMADFMRTCKGRVMVSINDHADIRQAFDGLPIRELSIRYSMANKLGAPAESGELMITNYEPVVCGGLF
jgi:DNA adenine methylase